MTEKVPYYQAISSPGGELSYQEWKLQEHQAYRRSLSPFGVKQASEATSIPEKACGVDLGGNRESHTCENELYE
jgi:hypothetical protein